MGEQNIVLLDIKEHDFQEAKDSLRRYTQQNRADISLDRVASSGGLFNLGTHKVEGEELNKVVSQIQDYLIDLNKLAQGLVGEFGQVYKAFESLDKDYIAGIVGSIKAAEKVSEEEQKDRIDIKRIIAEHEKSVKVLKKFKEDIEKLKHITDVDKAWDMISNQNKAIEAFREFQRTLSCLKHLLDIDSMWDHESELKKEVERLKDRAAAIAKTLEDQNGLNLEFDSAILAVRNELHSHTQKVDNDISVLENAVKKDIAKHRTTVDGQLASLKKSIDRNLEEEFKKIETYSTEQSKKISTMQTTLSQDLDGFRKEQAVAIEVANREQNERIESLSKEQAAKIKELSDAHCAEMELLNETISTLKTKLKIAYIIAGSTAVITVAHLILNFWVF